MSPTSRTRSSGFSMIEVLVSLLITVIGVLGMVALQSKAIPFTQDSAQRNTAIMLVDDLLEIIRTTGSCTSANNCVKPPGSAFTQSSSCVPTPATLGQQIGCWAIQAGNALPGGDALLSSKFYICRSVKPGDVKATACATDSVVDTEIEIQVAWTVREGANCMAADTVGTTCTYRIRTRLP
jgi:type IV pilus assembly protein PilV